MCKVKPERNVRVIQFALSWSGQEAIFSLSVLHFIKPGPVAMLLKQKCLCEADCSCQCLSLVLLCCTLLCLPGAQISWSSSAVHLWDMKPHQHGMGWLVTHEYLVTAWLIPWDKSTERRLRSGCLSPVELHWPVRPSFPLHIYWARSMHMMPWTN